MPSPSQSDYFAVFSLPRKLQLDTPELERSFYRLSRKLHPDLFATKSAEEQQWSLDQTSLLNDAYRTLKNPVARTEHLLRLEGVVLEAGKNEDGAAKDSRVPPDLLEEVFELNMQLEEMRMNRKMGEDDPQLRGDLEKARANFASQLADVDSNLERQWTAWDAALDSAPADEKDKIKEAMVALLDRRRYIRNLVNSVNDALDA